MTEEEKEVGIQDVRRLLKKAKDEYNREHPNQKIYKVGLALWTATQDILDVLSGDDEKYEKVLDAYIKVSNRKNTYSRLIVKYQPRPIDGPYHKPAPLYVAYGLEVRLFGK